MGLGHRGPRAVVGREVLLLDRLVGLGQVLELEAVGMGMGICTSWGCGLVGRPPILGSWVGIILVLVEVVQQEQEDGASQESRVTARLGLDHRILDLAAVIRVMVMVMDMDMVKAKVTPQGTRWAGAARLMTS